MVKKAKYEPFGEELCVEVAYLQAAALLDCAAQEAVNCKDTERMQNLALSWMELGKLLIAGPASDDDEDDEDESDKPFLGFNNNGHGKVDIANERVGESEANTSRVGFPGLHPKHGEL